MTSRTGIAEDDARDSIIRLSEHLPHPWHGGERAPVPDLARFFRAQAGRVRIASFQAQAQTGRGVHEKKIDITLDAVAGQIEKGAETTINFASSLIGHLHCSRYGHCFEAGGTLYDALDDAGFIAGIQLVTRRRGAAVFR